MNSLQGLDIPDMNNNSQSLRDFNTALRQHSDALARLAQRLRVAEEKNQQTVTSQDQLLSRIEKLEHFVVRADADRRRNDDQINSQLQQTNKTLDEVSKNSQHNNRATQQLTMQFEQYRNSDASGRSESNYSSGISVSESRLEARLAAVESRLDGNTSVKERLQQENRQQEIRQADLETRQMIERLEKIVGSGNEKIRQEQDRLSTKTKEVFDMCNEVKSKTNQQATQIQALNQNSASPSVLSTQMDEKIQKAISKLADEVSSNTQRHVRQVSHKLGEMEQKLRDQDHDLKKTIEKSSKNPDQESKILKIETEIKAIQKGCESLEQEIEKMGTPEDPTEKIEDAVKPLKESIEKLQMSQKNQVEQGTKTEVMVKELETFEKALRDRFEEHWEAIKRMVEHEVKHGRGKIKTSQEAVELAVKALATQLDSLSSRVDEERDIMIDNIVEHFNNKHEDLEVKVDDLYNKLVEGVKKFTAGTPLQKEVSSKMLEIEKSIRKDMERKYQQINKSVQAENSGLRTLCTKERQTALQATAKLERKMLRLEGKFNTENRRLEKSVVSDNNKCVALDSKVEAMQETLSNKLKLIVTNMEHEVDDLRSNQQMDRMDIKNDILKHLEEFKTNEHSKVSDLDGRLASVAKVASRAEDTVTSKLTETKNILIKVEKIKSDIIHESRSKLKDLRPEIDTIKSEVSLMRQQLLVIRNSIRAASTIDTGMGSEIGVGGDASSFMKNGVMEIPPEKMIGENSVDI